MAKPIIDPALYQIKGSYGQALNILKQLRRKNAQAGEDRKIKYEYEKQMPRFDVVRTAALAGATTIDVTHSEYFLRYQLWKNERAQDIVQVLTAASADNLPLVARGFGTVSAQPWSAGDVLIKLESVGSDGQKMADMQWVKSEWAYNYLMEQRMTVAVTDWAATMQMYHSNAWDRAMRQNLAVYQENEVASFLHSQLKTSTVDHSSATNIGGIGSSTTAKVYAMAGFIQQMRDNAPEKSCIDISGTITKTKFIDMIGDWAFTGSDQKLVCMGKILAKAQGIWKDQKVMMVPRDENYSMILKTWEVFPGKTITLAYDSSLDVPDVGTPTRGEMLLGLDLGTDGNEAFTPEIHVCQPNIVDPITLADAAHGKAVDMWGSRTLIMGHPEAQLFAEGIRDAA
jgi:hypothetical protein